MNKIRRFKLEVFISIVFLFIIATIVFIMSSNPRERSKKKASNVFSELGGEVVAWTETHPTLCARLVPITYHYLVRDYPLLRNIPLDYPETIVTKIRFHNQKSHLVAKEKLLKAVHALNDASICNFKNSGIGDEFLKQMTHFEALKILILENCPVSDDGIKYLKSSKLNSLDLSGTSVHGNFLETAIQLKTIQYLRLSNTNISDSAMIKIRDHHNLYSLELDGTEISDDALKQIKELAQLRRLNLANTKIGDNALKYISEINNITSLNLQGTKISDNGLKYLSELKNLTYLKLNETDISDLALPILANFANLKWLDIRKTRITQNALMRFQKLKPDIIIFVETMIP
jgi:hypothetical protein